MAFLLLCLVFTLKPLTFIVLYVGLGHLRLASIKREENKETVPEVTGGDLLESRRVYKRICGYMPPLELSEPRL